MKRRTLWARILAVLLVMCLFAGMAPVYAVSVGNLLEGHEIKGADVDADSINHFEYTPSEDGYYFLVTHPEMPAFMPCNHSSTGAVAASNYFDFDDDDGHGNVYQLTNGVKYCFAADNENRNDFVLNIKKVDVATDFTIPTTMEGYAGTKIWLPIEFDGALSTEVTSSDLTTVNTETGGNAHEHELELLKAGTATVTVTSHNGVVKTCTVTVKSPESIGVNGTKTAVLGEGESVSYSFTPTESGSYALYTLADYGMYPVEFSINAPCDMWETNGYRGMSAFDLVAGNTYTWEVRANWGTECPVTLFKVDAMTGLTLQQDKMTVYPGFTYTIGAAPDPVYGLDRKIEWTSDNTQVAVVEGTSLTSVNIHTEQVGTANITASWTDDNGNLQSKTCVVTVETPEPFAEGETKTITLNPNESTGYVFTPATSGAYILCQSMDGPAFDMGIEGPGGANWRSETTIGNICYGLEAGESYPIFVRCGEWEESAITTDVTLIKAEATEGISIDGPVAGYTNSVEGCQILYTPEFGASDMVTWTISDSNIAEFVGESPNSCELLLKAVGKVTLTATSVEDSAITATLDITVGEREEIKLDETKTFTISEGQNIEYTFTPTETGVYAVSCPDNMPFWGEWHDINGEWICADVEICQNGRFYQFLELNAGTTYVACVRSNEDPFGQLDGDVTVNKAVQATELILNDLEVYVGDNFILEYVFGPGVAIPEEIIDLKISDENVLALSDVVDWNIHIDALEVGETKVTIESVSGLTAEATIKVLPIPELILGEKAEVEIGFGESIYHVFVPERSCDYYLTFATDGGCMYAVGQIEADEPAHMNAFASAASEKTKLSLKAGETYIVIAIGEDTNGATITLLMEPAHNLTKTAGTAATCTQDGTMDSYTCSKCGALFSDAEGKTEATKADLVIKASHKLTKVAAVEPTYDAAGNVEHYKCSVCAKLFADAAGKTETTAAAVVLAQLIKVEKETAVVSPEAVDKAIEDAGTTGEVVIDVTETENKVAEVELPVAALETLVKAEKPLTVVTEDATVVLDTATMSAVAAAANGGEITLRVEQIETKTLNKKQQEAVADHTVLVTISANIYSGDQYIGDFKGGKATVKVPLKLDKDEKGSDYSVFYVDDEGNLEPVECYYKNGDMYFVTGHFSEYIIAKAPVEEKDPTVPNTGDNANLGLMTALLMISVMGIACTVVLGKKAAYTGKWER